MVRTNARAWLRVVALIQSGAPIVDRNGGVRHLGAGDVGLRQSAGTCCLIPLTLRRSRLSIARLKYADVKDKLDADKSFVWIKRGLSPREHDLVNRLGIPGLEFQAEERRIYPQGSTGAHVVGYASIDKSGLAGIERYFDQQLQSGEPVQLSIDLRLQRMVEDEMVAAVKKFSAIGATAIVMDVTNGEILAMASLPSYDANKAKTITNEALFNRATLGVYEQGSTFKIFNTAMALDSGKVTWRACSTPPAHQIDRFTINDDHPQHGRSRYRRIFTYSSISLRPRSRPTSWARGQRAFFDKIGFLKPLPASSPSSPRRCGRGTG
jgi:cell division protein FtsI (penicillin-binding protein 3)